MPEQNNSTDSATLSLAEQEELEQEKKQIKEEIAFFAERALKFRVEMPEHEAKHSWLCTLLDAYAIIDGGTSYLIEEEAKLNTHLACKAGCYLCCIEPIPAGPLESLGLAFASRYLLKGEKKEKLKKQLLEHNGKPEWQNGTCPFLLDNTCAVYELRPIACRNYLAFNSPCYLKEGGPVIFHNKLENYRIPSRVALKLASLHITATCKEMGLYQGDKQIIMMDETRELYLDVRGVSWLTNDIYKRFFSE